MNKRVTLSLETSSTIYCDWLCYQTDSRLYVIPYTVYLALYIGAIRVLEKKFAEIVLPN